MIKIETNDKKYYVVHVQDDDEKILYTYDDKDLAIAQMRVVGRKLKPRCGIAVVIKGYLGPDWWDGHITILGRETIAVYDAWLDRFLSQY